MTRPRVLFVSKAVAPPFHDGAACLVRDLCAGLSRCDATVMTTRDAPPIAGGVGLARIYADRSGFSPALRDNARVFAHVLADRHHDIWHFVFAPNPLSSQAASALRRLRHRPVVQTVASQPRSFTDVSALLFGDRVVVLSRYTADRMIDHGVDRSRLVVIRPPLADLTRSASEQAKARRDCGIPDSVPIFVYPGDLEFSRGAETVARAVPSILRRVPDARVVFACRAKTPRARGAQTRLAVLLDEHRERVVFAGEVGDLPSLLATATAVLFPVDELYGKVDLPYAVLEACLLRVPVVVASRGPLVELEHAPQIAAGDASALAEWCASVATDDGARQQLGERLRELVLSTCSPGVVAAAYEELYTDLVRRSAT